MDDHQQLQRFMCAELWTLREAAYLLCDQMPPHDPSGFIEEMKSGSTVALTYKELKNSTRAESLKFIKADGRDTLMNRLVYPADAVAWATSRGIAVPAGLHPIGRTTARDAPAAAVPVQHVLGRHVMSSAIKLAGDAAEMQVEGSSNEVGPVWTQLEALGRQKPPPQPIVKVTTGGVVYLQGGDTKVYTRKALSDHMRREKARYGAPRRKP